ncbi:MAG TPA: macrolide transporter subunit MacA [Desulfuromonadales bacterium]|nr:macrolide transporter subunit MacA [Desulfuromonadales bacterium]
MRISRTKSLLLLLAVTVLAIGAYFFKRQFLTAKPAEYITATVERMDLEERILASGTLNAHKTVEVGAQVSGQLKKLHVALGNQVKKGQLLAEIDPVLQQNSLLDAEASLENMKAQKRAKLALLHQYELAYKRTKQMTDKDAASQADLESALAQLESTQADMVSLDAQINRARVSVDTATANLQYTRIVAPIDGVVIAIVTEEGQTVVSSQAAPTILKLADLETMTVKTQISEADVIRARPGQTAYFTVLGDTVTRYYGKLRAIEPGPVSSSSSSGTANSAVYYNGLFDVPNTDSRLRVAMTAQVSIVLNSVKQALCIPGSALREKGKNGLYTVKVLVNNIPETRSVGIGMSNNINTQVLEGLKEGEKVIIGDSYSLPPSEKTPSMPPPPRKN